MNKRKSFIPTLIFLCLTVLDIGLTFLATPDLTDEGNPISMVFKFGWFALMLANMFAVAVFAVFAHISFDRYKTPVFTADNFFEFYLMLFYNTKTMVVKPMFKLPKNWMPFWAMISFSACIALLAGRVVVVLEWIAILLGQEYSMYFMIRQHVPFGRTDIWVFILAFLVSTLVWMQKEFKKIRKHTENCSKFSN